MNYSERHHRTENRLTFDVIDLDSEAAIDAALNETRAGREHLRGPVVQTGHGFHGA